MDAISARIQLELSFTLMTIYSKLRHCRCDSYCRFECLCVLRVWVFAQVRVARVARPMGPQGAHGAHGPDGTHGSVRMCGLRALHVWVCAQVQNLLLRIRLHLNPQC